MSCLSSASSVWRILPSQKGFIEYKLLLCFMLNFIYIDYVYIFLDQMKKKRVVRNQKNVENIIFFEGSLKVLVA